MGGGFAAERDDDGAPSISRDAPSSSCDAPSPLEALLAEVGLSAHAPALAGLLELRVHAMCGAPAAGAAAWRRWTAAKTLNAQRAASAVPAAERTRFRPAALQHGNTCHPLV